RRGAAGIRGRAEHQSAIRRRKTGAGEIGAGAGWTMKTALFVLLMSLYASAALAVDEKKLVDMTYPFNEATQHWPTAHGFKLATHIGRVSARQWYAAYGYSPAVQVGTLKHAPLYFAPGQWKVGHGEL